MMAGLFGSSGVRRPYDRALVDLALQIGSTIGRRAEQVLVGIDTRTTSPLIADAFTSGVLGSGGKVGYAGMVPTPAVAYNTRTVNAGCMITASHNAEPDNGLKLFNRDGSSFTREQQTDLEEELHETSWNGWEKQGLIRGFDAVGGYTDAILERFPGGGGFPVVVDAGNGAGSLLTPGLLAEMGMTPVSINCTPMGHFSRPSEPLEKNLPYISGLIKKTGAKGAVVHDGDADRMMAFDGLGRYISGDHLLMLFIRYLGAQKVVTTVDTTMAIEELAEVRRTPVGDSNVSEALLEWGDFGGEPSGAWIFPNHSFCPDGPYAAALFCEIAREWDIPEELDAMPHYPMIRESLSIEQPGMILSEIGAAKPTDGIRIIVDDGWCLVRASGTEQKIRITAEGTTMKKAKEMFETGEELIRKGKLLIGRD
jgi:phosphoglucosamine mutase